MYYEDYITDRAATAFDYEKANFTHYDMNSDEVKDSLDESLNKQMFKGVMREVVAYLYDRRNSGDMDLLFNPENVSEIYVTARGLETPSVVVEYDELPEWFEMENAQLREFYWHPDPGLSGEWSAAYFQPR